MTIDFFSDEVRRNPYGVIRADAQALAGFPRPATLDAWLVFDYDNVRRVLSDHALFSSRVPAPRHWFIFYDPPQHTKMRGLISRAFTPRMVTNLGASHSRFIQPAAGLSY
jgi:cytochrome P450